MEEAVTRRGLRSVAWYAGEDRNAYIHRAWMRRGLPASAFAGSPQIAIANTASDLTPCNAHLTEVAGSVKNGIYEAGGIPLELPVVSLGETLLRPTAMLWRNMAAMATEEMLRANPIDGVVLLGGCDKTIPALLMAAASVDLPAVVVPGVRRLVTGGVRPFGPRHVHHVVNADPVGAVSIHVYAPSLTEMTEYARHGSLLHSSRSQLAGVNW